MSHLPHADARDATLEGLLVAQAGVVRIDQVRRWMTPAELRREVDAGRWQRAGRGVVVTHNAEPTLAQRRWVAVLAAPRGAALGFLTAAELEGLVGFPPEEVDLVLAAGARLIRLPGVRTRWSSKLDNEDVHPTHVPRRTRLARSVLDAAASSASERRSRTLILASVQQRLVRPADLREALQRRGPSRHHAVVVESIGDAEGGAHSLPEHDVTVLIRHLGLPEPTRQSRVQGIDGRWYLDLEWLRYRLGLEVHGTQHFQISAWDSDLDRTNELVISGRRILQITSYAVRRRPDHVGRMLLRAFESAGWRA